VAPGARSRCRPVPSVNVVERLDAQAVEFSVPVGIPRFDDLPARSTPKALTRRGMSTEPFVTR